MLMKVITTGNTAAILIMDSNFKMSFVKLFVIWRCCVLMLAILQLSLLKVLTILALFMTLANLIQSIYQKIHCLIIDDIYEMQFEVYNYFFDYLIKIIDGKNIKSI